MEFAMVKDILIEALVGDASQDIRALLWRTLLLTAFVFHMLWAGGLVPGFTEHGYVTIERFTIHAQRVKRIEQNQLLEHIQTLQEKMCAAIEANNKESTAYATSQRQIYANEYRELMADSPYIPTCRELGFSNRKQQ